MERESPSVVVLAGPNGAGKSTLASNLLIGARRVSEFVDADVLARTLPRSEAAAVAAGRAVLRRLDELAAGRRSFGFETTLASRSFVSRIRRLILGSYERHLVLLWLSSADLAVARVTLSAFDHDVANVRQFGRRPEVDCVGCWCRDAHDQ